MNEEKRQAYLRVMDIQAYFPRQVLAGAKASPHYDFPVPSAEASAAGELVADTGAEKSAIQKSPSSLHSRGLQAIDELRAEAQPARKATVTPISREQLKAEAPEEAAGQQEAESALSFSLRYYRINEQLAVLDEVPQQASPEVSQHAQKLMRAILAALNTQYGDSGLQVEEFSWPLQAGYQAKQSPQREASRALGGFLQMRHETDGFANLLVFADQLEGVILQSDQKEIARDFDSTKGYFMTVSHSLASMLSVATLKRDVWQHLQPLRRRLASTENAR